jgi:hypothetical protein
MAATGLTITPGGIRAQRRERTQMGQEKTFDGCVTDTLGLRGDDVMAKTMAAPSRHDVSSKIKMDPRLTHAIHGVRPAGRLRRSRAIRSHAVARMTQ